ncbi:MAG: hypothetical protein H6835_14680 [Planctomycetes bacterium]|nr:hypothetical protein [Planctomycetota bacterium]
MSNFAVGPNPAERLQLAFAGVDGCDVTHLSVDGMTPTGPNLSHWPGNRTPRAWKADLSTGIALNFARAGAAEQEAFLGDAELVLNDHYDTDGFGALLAVLRPHVALAREELLLSAAATGDFGVFTTWRGFAIDRIVAGLARPESPVRGAFHGVENPDAKSLARYRWLLDHAESVLDHPGGYKALYEEELARVKGEIARGLAGDVQREAFAELGFAALRSDGGRHRMTLNTLAAAFRVLHVQRDADGTRYRYHDRTESWFELVTIGAPPRLDLRPLARRLGELEPERDGASWNADPPTEPIPELYFGVPSAQEYGRISRELRPSALPAEGVVAAFAAFFADAGRRSSRGGDDA